MSNIIPVPSLSAAGWIVSSAEKADALLSHFYESEKSQSYLYGQNITNCQWLLEQYGNNIIEITSQIRSALQVYLGRYYDAVNVEVTNDDNADNPSGKITLHIYIDVTEDGKTYSMGQLLNITNSKIQKIIRLNNTGTN